MVDGQLSAAEPLGQPAGRDRGQGARVWEWVAAWPAAAYSTLGWTAPMNIRPPSVISTDSGRMFVGAVQPSVLYAAASQAAAGSSSTQAP